MEGERQHLKGHDFAKESAVGSKDMRVCTTQRYCSVMVD